VASGAPEEIVELPSQNLTELSKGTLQERLTTWWI
jgi:hypothetical protein